MSKDGKAWTESHWTPRDEGAEELPPPSCNFQSPSFGCTWISVSARRFASWTALTPLPVGCL